MLLLLFLLGFTEAVRNCSHQSGSLATAVFREHEFHLATNKDKLNKMTR